ncbi:hypothetical protein SAMN05444008_110163 [Cnuella takakiae]|uniref:Uncharacterized protein n=1 Tax=Cnuella takakiae TaxID=1302690 RepID=A0A1M5DBV4_9BACT|nr:hypothetical protein [Cnuella takakiae]SHF64405.1 hypothetical protein SAMN05444008_110163 [Cnuella takakiae]
MRHPLQQLLVLLFLAFSPTLLRATPPEDHLPKSITRSQFTQNNRSLIRTVVQLDKNTTAQDVIQACNFLAAEGVTLRFSTLKIGRSFVGIAGKKRILVANGELFLPGGKSQQFNAGGLLGFRYLSLQYVTDAEGKSAMIEMISSVD